MKVPNTTICECFSSGDWSKMAFSNCSM